MEYSHRHNENLINARCEKKNEICHIFGGGTKLLGPFGALNLIGNKYRNRYYDVITGTEMEKSI